MKFLSNNFWSSLSLHVVETKVTLKRMGAKNIVLLVINKSWKLKAFGYNFLSLLGFKGALCPSFKQNKKLMDFRIFFCAFLKYDANQKIFYTTFEILIIHKPSLAIFFDLSVQEYIVSWNSFPINFLGGRICEILK